MAMIIPKGKMLSVCMRGKCLVIKDEDERRGIVKSDPNFRVGVAYRKSKSNADPTHYGWEFCHTVTVYFKLV